MDCKNCKTPVHEVGRGHVECPECGFFRTEPSGTWLPVESIPADTGQPESLLESSPVPLIQPGEKPDQPQEPQNDDPATVQEENATIPNPTENTGPSLVEPKRGLRIQIDIFDLDDI